MLPRGGPRSYYITLAIASCAVTSLGINTINQRDTHKAERIRLTTKQSVLRELVERYRRGEHVPDNEEQRLLRLADLRRKNEPDEQKTTVMEAIFGRQAPPEDEERELQKLREFWEEGLREDERQKSTLS
ncbi:hypothetical protein CALVIDRAFT_568916 [Calocera viscosa TUFC12733]|uniref:Uncharacterized protein n=1 Tax=Calocera viscosa (strain TUFC12733) TaxID=1330018 RepID=A0A167GHZ4_CALVF|nr:hypothetical protein CALVIDRAFT_568916 [Calocera viscosa TUFC12733]